MPSTDQTARSIGKVMTAPVRSWGANTNIGIVLASIGAILALAAVVIAVTGSLPLLGWVGFAIGSAIVCALGLSATLAVPRLRVSPPEPAAVLDRERRLLVIADSSCSELALRNGIVARLENAVAVHIVVPIRVSHLHFLTDDESDERRDAEQSLSITIGLLRERGIPTTGSIGTDKPLESMSDALGLFPASEVLLAVPPAEDSYWLERELLAKARALTPLPVTQIIAPSPAPAVTTRAAT